MKNRIFKIFFVLLFPFVLNAQEGYVVEKKSLCTYYLLESKSSFAIFQWYGGSDIENGDILVGDFDTYGVVELYNSTKDTMVKIKVEEYLLSSNSAYELYEEKCK